MNTVDHASFVFVGEKPSNRAYASGLTWRDGMLAARTLFDALKACDLKPEDQEFTNLFGDTPEASERPGEETRRRAANIRLLAGERPVVALGNKVSAILDLHGIIHLKMVHPAARGRIRKKERYIAHVGEVLRAGIQTFPP